MPLKSKAQVRKYMELHRQGKITKTQLDEAMKVTNFHGLPERITPIKQPKIKKVKVIK